MINSTFYSEDVGEIWNLQNITPVNGMNGNDKKLIFSFFCIRSVINGKAGKAVASPNFSDTLTLSQPRWADYAHHITTAPLQISRPSTIW